MRWLGGPSEERRPAWIVRAPASHLVHPQQGYYGFPGTSIGSPDRRAPGTNRVIALWSLERRHDVDRRQGAAVPGKGEFGPGVSFLAKTHVDALHVPSRELLL